MCASIHFKCALYISPCMQVRRANFIHTEVNADIPAPQNNTELKQMKKRGVSQGPGSVVQIKISKTVTPQQALLASAPYVHVHKQTGSGPLGIFSICSGESKSGSGRGSLVFISCDSDGLFGVCHRETGMSDRQTVFQLYL